MSFSYGSFHWEWTWIAWWGGLWIYYCLIDFKIWLNNVLCAYFFIQNLYEGWFFSIFGFLNERQIQIIIGLDSNYSNNLSEVCVWLLITIMKNFKKSDHKNKIKNKSGNWAGKHNKSRQHLIKKKTFQSR